MIYIITNARDMLAPQLYAMRDNGAVFLSPMLLAFEATELPRHAGLMCREATEHEMVQWVKILAEDMRMFQARLARVETHIAAVRAKQDESLAYLAKTIAYLDQTLGLKSPPAADGPVPLSIPALNGDAESDGV